MATEEQIEAILDTLELIRTVKRAAPDCGSVIGSVPGAETTSRTC